MYSLFLHLRQCQLNFGKFKMQEKPSTTFLGLFFLFLFFVNQFSLFFSVIL